MTINMQKEHAKNAADGMAMASLDIQTLYGTLTRTNPLGAVAVLGLIQKAAELEAELHNIYNLMGE